LLSAVPAAAASVDEGTPRLQLRVEALAGQPTTLLGTRAGLGVGLGWKLTDQISAVGDAQTRAAPGGGITSFAAGLAATLDITPVEPYIEVAVVTFTNGTALGYSLAARTGVGADFPFARGLAVGAVVRSYIPFDARSGASAVAGVEAAVRLAFTPGAR
jgi:hypothetical protein